MSELKLKGVDGGKPFDWGRTSADYGKYRDVYPEEMYQRLLDNGIGLSGQTVLDVGTGTGVIPRNMHRFGAEIIGTDISEAQIEQAKALAASGDMKIEFFVSSAEEIVVPENSLDCITAFTCFFYFDHEKFAPAAAKMLKKGGKLAVGYLAWLTFESEIAMQSERLILKYNPAWSGKDTVRSEVYVPEVYNEYFNMVFSGVFDVELPFTRESWNGRMKACRGIGASLDAETAARFEKEHMELLEKTAPEKFGVLHYYALKILEVK